MEKRPSPLAAWRPLAVLAALVLLTGCLTIEEHYTFKKDGSGTMEYVMDMSAMQDLFNSFNTQDGEGTAGKKDGKKADAGGVTGGMDEQVARLKQVAGIKKVKLKKEKDGYVERVSFAFADVDALNRALNVLMPDSADTRQEFFRWEGNTLVRMNNRYAAAIGKDLSSGDDTTGVADMLGSMKYKFSFTFASPVGRVQAGPGMAREQPRPKQLELATDFSEIMKDPAVLDLRIALDR